ncbi:MAG: nuclear transport factor 2 family protein [Acidobacteriota bacterium]
MLGAVACTSKKEVNAAKHSLYDTDFAIVYQAALEATREHYPNLDDNPGPGRIQTAWHQVQFSNCPASGSTCDDSANALVLNPGGASATAGGVPTQNGATAMPTRLAYKRYFVRFEVSVIGGRPWRVKVVGHASEWDPGAAMPVEMRGANKPPWLDPRTDALRVSIYKRIKQYAIPMKDEEPKEQPDEPKTDPATFANVPAPAAKRLAEIKDALDKRDYAALRPLLADDIVWSLGGGTGADTAMAMWQADPAQLDAMLAVLPACTAAGDKKVTCPAGQPQPAQYQLVLESRADGWKVTSFVKNE